MSDKTNIQVSIETRDFLNDIGRKGDTYDSVIQRLIQRWKADEDVLKHCTCSVGSGAHSDGCDIWKFWDRETNSEEE